MRDVKYRYETLGLYEYKRVEEHLSRMAAKGWRLERIGLRLWKYRRAEPAQVRYAVTYIRDASQFNPGPTEAQQSLEELCAAAGWVKVTDWFQMQIYCSELADPVPLETEEAVRLEAVHRSMKRNFLSVSLILLAVSLILFGRFLYTLATDFYHILESSSSLFTGPLWLLSSLALVVSLGHYWLWYRRSARAVAQGGPCAVPGNLRWLNRLGSAFLILWIGLYLSQEMYQDRPGAVAYFLIHFFLIYLIAFLMRKATALFRRWKLTWGQNLLFTLLVDAALCAVLIGGLTYIVLNGGWLDGGSGKTYTYLTEEWDVSPQEIPLTVSDLTGEEYSHIRRSSNPQGSALLGRTSYRELVQEGSRRLALSYEITRPPLRLYDTVLAGTLAPHVDSYSFRGITFSWSYAWEEVPAAPWGAEAAYRQLLDGKPRDTWLLVFPDRLAVISPDWDLTPEQMALAGEILKTA